MTNHLRKTTFSLVALVLAVPLAGCASSGATAAKSTPPPGDEACFDASMATSFSYLHQRYVYVSDVGGKNYLLTLADECQALQNAMNLAISSRFNFVCSHSGAAITFMSFSQKHFCRILTVEQVKDKAAAEALVKERTTPSSSR